MISRKALRQLPAAASGTAPLDRWFDLAAHAQWDSIRDVRRVCPQADAVRVASGHEVTVFNIGGNKYRLLAAMRL